MIGSSPRPASGRIIDGGSRTPSATHHRSPQYLENDGGRPTKQQHAVHRRHRPEQPPALHRGYVAVAERRVVHESEIHDIGAGGRGIDDGIGQRPDEHLRHVRGHQDRDGCDHDEDQEQDWPRYVLRGGHSRYSDHHRHHQRMDRNVAKTDGRPHEKLTKHALELLPRVAYARTAPAAGAAMTALPAI